ncbi:3-dehydroquinate synthase [Alkalicoccobacillus murimartini]|uniref:3-dehydroquinate synthase n=1 Tax=Alkalicoccobacillus murimartini TaxID=171685 RepID=A0ABT9YEK3_9BACI|nr:3-dehydroquinate synthase [Alkalicoccobacillus murimartini]MDQ0205920.1 3-dehydroquinate synthase [Alkalicoccobacillus murimartini]
MNKVQVNTQSHTYEVYLDKALRFRVGDLLSQCLKEKPSSVFVITDSTVAPLYLQDVLSSLPDDLSVSSAIIPSGEQSKSFKEYENLLSQALKNGLDRKSVIIALGGGVVGDIAGFVAASYMRGIRFIQMPTTLLAHDSSVGGKVAINHELGKNMVGAFHQPEAVFYDTDVLFSLPQKEWRAGFAEVLKHGLILDKSFYEWLQKNVTDFLSIDNELVSSLLARSIAIKAEVVSQDEREQGIRAYLNLGHTLGHAIEAVSGYGKITHGEAVVIGIVFAMKLSERLYKIDLDIPAFKAWVESFGYETVIPKDLDHEKLLEAMKKDKKTEAGIIRMVLLKKLGEACVEKVETDVILSLLKES